MNFSRAWLFFEQSGTFKRAFKSLGFDAYDVDISDDFGETDFRVDLYHEIESMYLGLPSFFDKVGPSDIAFAFFPCVYFSCVSQMHFNWNFKNYKNLSFSARLEKILERNVRRNENYVRLVKLYFCFLSSGRRLIIENPYSENTYLKGNFIAPPSYIDKDRTRRGDKFVKPTAYWFVNCVPGGGFTSDPCPKSPRPIIHCAKSLVPGVCSSERSLISERYALNFIRDQIISCP